VPHRPGAHRRLLTQLCGLLVRALLVVRTVASPALRELPPPTGRAWLRAEPARLALLWVLQPGPLGRRRLLVRSRDPRPPAGCRAVGLRASSVGPVRASRRVRAPRAG
jgi:hypothetical protein